MQIKLFNGLNLIPIKLSASIFFLLLFLASCQKKKETRFQLLKSEDTGIEFTNDLESTPDFNIINYLYFYDGGGVSIGDVNNDGLSDIYLTANMISNRLYLNKGNFKFQEITEKAGVGGKADWTTGTTMADVNGDGLLDIYVSSVNYLTKSGRNQLFINNGDSTFTDRATEYGLDFKGYSKQASFFDYDNDGDLDVYLLNHAVHSRETFARAEKRMTYSENGGDKLYRNDDGIYKEVTREAGIYSSIIGYGLAATVSDVNTDGCQDIYISNDFHENDYLYLNNCDGTFDEVLQDAIGHTSRASMGSDIADFNNDAKPDIYVLDMLPYEEHNLKTSVSAEYYKVYDIQRRYGYHPQLIRNTLQLNLGTAGKDSLLFAEISQYANVHATDWSWGSLFMDMDNDGRKDLFVTNGIYRRPNDLDYLTFIQQDTVQKILDKGLSKKTMGIIDLMPEVKIPNRAFKNEGAYTFSDQTDPYGFNINSTSNGVAYGDLDNDGDLDLVINNVNATAFVYKNNTSEKTDNRFLKIKLKGANENTYGIGSKISFYAKGKEQLYEMMPTRGFLSSVEPIVTAGMDTLQSLDSLRVIWPDGSYQTRYDVQTNQTLEIYKDETTGIFDYTQKTDHSSVIFEQIGKEEPSLFTHQENVLDDYAKQPLMPYKLSTQGPRLAVADINDDGLDDFYVGGATYQSGSLFVQEEDGTFKSTNDQLFEDDKSFEDVAATFFDANGDGTKDLYVVSGGNGNAVGSREFEDRLYFNDGKNNFVRIYDALPPAYLNGATVAPADYDSDGDIDLFIGNRSVPNNYGYTPSSYLLENNGQGKFSIAETEVAPGLRNIGMVTDAIWEDINDDNKQDLILVGEWMPITIFINEDGILKNVSKTSELNNTNGWWNHINSGDFDEDGDIDFVVGNIGLNAFFKPSIENPLSLYVKDLNRDGQMDPLIAYSKGGIDYPLANRDELLSEFKFLRKKYPAYKDFGGESISNIFGQRLEDSVEVKKAYMFESVLLENNGNATFTVRSLPSKAQFAPIFSTAIYDFNADGKLDILAGGNFFDVKPSVGGRYDASHGWFLKGDGSGTFKVVNRAESGFSIKGQIRDIKLLNAGRNNVTITVAQNDEELLLFRLKDTN